jgi:hypothetical protein
MWIVGLCILVGGLLASCSSTTMVSHWRDPSYTGGKLQKVLVIGVAPNAARRRQFEDSFVSVLGRSKVQALPSYQQFPEASAITQEDVESYARAQNVTQILVARVVDKQTVQEYVPPSVSTYGGGYPGYYGGWYPYYSMSYTTVSSPGYTYDRIFVTVETNVYDVGTAKMIWNGMSNTELGSTLESNIRDYIETVAGYMAQDKLF